MSLLALFDQNLLQIQRLLQLLARPREDHLFEAPQPQEKLGAHHPQRLQGALSRACLFFIWASASKSQSPSWIKIWKLIQTWKYNGSQFCENFPPKMSDLISSNNDFYVILNAFITNTLDLHRFVHTSNITFALGIFYILEGAIIMSEIVMRVPGCTL